MQRELVKILKETVPTITEVEYFSDRCAAQYKNYNNMLNLCRHKENFGITQLGQVFFATSHGKSPCDGIGGTVKRLTARATILAKTTDYTVIILPDDYVPNQKP